MIADIFESDNQQYAVAFIVFSSVGGSVLGPVVGGFIQQYLPWQWCIWIQLIFGVAVQLAHLSWVPETRTTVLLGKIAWRMREEGIEPPVYGPNELISLRERLSVKEILTTWGRPFKMFLTEPIVLTLSLLSGFSDAIIFMQIQSFGLVYQQWGFSTYEIGLAFLPILIGYFIAWAIFIPGIRRNKAERERKPNDEHAQYESRLWLLLYTAPLLPIGLIIFAWTSGGPPIHWIGTMFGSAIIGIASYAIYMATIDYMICAYGPYSASATGGNGLSRDFLAGVLTVPATPFYTNIGRPGRHLQDGNTILFCISCLLVVFVYIIYWKGPALRKRSPFAQKFASARNQDPSPPGVATTGTTTPATAGATTPRSPRPGPGSRRSTYEASAYAAARSRQNSRPNSASNSANVSVVDLHALELEAFRGQFEQDEARERFEEEIIRMRDEGLRRMLARRGDSYTMRMSVLREARTREEREGV
jgi:MFS family permease